MKLKQQFEFELNKFMEKHEDGSDAMKELKIKLIDVFVPRVLQDIEKEKVDAINKVRQEFINRRDKVLEEQYSAGIKLLKSMKSIVAAPWKKKPTPPPPPPPPQSSSSSTSSSTSTSTSSSSSSSTLLKT